MFICQRSSSFSYTDVEGLSPYELEFIFSLFQEQYEKEKEMLRQSKRKR